MEDIKNSCLFCKIINGDVPNSTVYEDHSIIAFLDIDPISEGHTLIIPKKHYQDIYDIDEAIAGKIVKKAGDIALTLKKTFGFDAITLTQNNDACQDVLHFHLHVYGRNMSNDIKFKYPDKPTITPKEVLKLLQQNKH